MKILRNSSLILLFVLLANLLLTPVIEAQATTETVLSSESAYNPIPSPDGRYLAYVRTGWGRNRGFSGMGRSNLVSEVFVIDSTGHLLKRHIVDGFLSGWTSDGNLVCYRDGNYYLVSMTGKRLEEGLIGGLRIVVGGTERVSYLPNLGIIWSRQDSPFHTSLETPKGRFAEQRGWQGELMAPSPNGRYIAIAGGWSAPHIWIYDTDLRHWAYLGDAEIHPDQNWDYIKPSWNPWFADSSRLAYFTHEGSVLSISTPDGKQQTDIQVKGPAGLAAPSLDGNYIAYVSFDPRPDLGRSRPDLQFWGGTQVWVVPASGKPEPRPVTRKSLDETYDLRWLDDHTLVFDRVADVTFYKQSRLWKADVPR